jgi:hypothetical protein
MFMRVGVLAAALATVPVAAHAQWEVEADPVAYGLKGFSGHLGRQIADGAGRLQIGVYGVDVPEAWHGNDGVTQRARGVTAKADYFLRGQPSGLFVGMDGTFSRTRHRHDAKGSEVMRNGGGIGPRVGYRFNLGDHLYITPWVSVSYLFNASDMVLAGERFEQRRYLVFPTVHVGWRF